MTDEKEVKRALSYINDVDDYKTWIDVGMALQAGGFPIDMWIEWSSKGAKFRGSADCEEHWNSFKNDGEIGIGTLFHYARDGGYSRPVPASSGWDDPIMNTEDVSQAAQNRPIWEDNSRPFDPFEQISDYLHLLFKEDDIVCYCTAMHPNSNGELKPDEGTSVKVSELLDSLQAFRETGSLDNVIGPYDPSVGAYIRVNPMDGKGSRDINVADFRWTLIESDEMDLNSQYAMLKNLQLPIKALVYSGGKSIHAIVPIHARNNHEYAQKVNELHSRLNKLGYICDGADKNPSRYTRLPGIIRGDRKQMLIGHDLGMHSLDEWNDYADSLMDDLPNPFSLDTVWEDPPKLAPELIEGVLRLGHKMIISGPSKAGKSFALIELAFAIAEGMNWMGCRCRQGKVLYLNMEIDTASFVNRVRAVYDAHGMLRSAHPENIVLFPLRGYGRSIAKLTPSIIRRAKGQGFEAIIIDPLYKVLDGDENSNSDIAHMLGYFDQIARETGASVIYSHHFAKGIAGDKAMIDRASGAGSFARDPDAILTLTQLNWKDESSDGNSTAWQLEFTLREFPNREPVKMFFEYPVHKIDTEGKLDDCDVLTKEVIGNMKSTEVRQRKMHQDEDLVTQIVEDLSFDSQPVTINAIKDEYFELMQKEISRTTVQRRLKAIGYIPTDRKYHRETVYQKTEDE